MAATGVPKTGETREAPDFTELNRRALVLTAIDSPRVSVDLKRLGIYMADWTDDGGVRFSVSHIPERLDAPQVNVMKSIRRYEKFEPLESFVWDPTYLGAYFSPEQLETIEFIISTVEANSAEQ